MRQLNLCQNVPTNAQQPPLLLPHLPQHRRRPRPPISEDSMTSATIYRLRFSASNVCLEHTSLDYLLRLSEEIRNLGTPRLYYSNGNGWHEHTVLDYLLRLAAQIKNLGHPIIYESNGNGWQRITAP